MKSLTKATFEALLSQTSIKPRLKKDLKFITSMTSMAADWSDYELLPIADRTGNAGVLLLQPGTDLFIIPYEISRRIVDSTTGRDRAIICDFCFTWQPGSGAASITFRHKDAGHSVRMLCCADLLCSQHVRTATNAGRVSRAHLRESLDDDGRTIRLKQRLEAVIVQLEASPLVQ